MPHWLAGLPSRLLYYLSVLFAVTTAADIDECEIYMSKIFVFKSLISANNRILILMFLVHKIIHFYDAHSVWIHNSQGHFLYTINFLVT